MRATVVLGALCALVGECHGFQPVGVGALGCPRRLSTALARHGGAGLRNRVRTVVRMQTEKVCPERDRLLTLCRGSGGRLLILCLWPAALRPHGGRDRDAGAQDGQRSEVHAKANVPRGNRVALPQNAPLPYPRLCCLRCFGRLHLVSIEHTCAIKCSHLSRISIVPLILTLAPSQTHLLLSKYPHITFLTYLYILFCIIYGVAAERASSRQPRESRDMTWPRQGRTWQSTWRRSWV
jgi:hypothetical protein